MKYYTARPIWSVLSGYIADLSFFITRISGHTPWDIPKLQRTSWIVWRMSIGTLSSPQRWVNLTVTVIHSVASSSQNWGRVRCHTLHRALISTILAILHHHHLTFFHGLQTNPSSHSLILKALFFCLVHHSTNVAVLVIVIVQQFQVGCLNHANINNFFRWNASVVGYPEETIAGSTLGLSSVAFTGDETFPICCRC